MRVAMFEDFDERSVALSARHRRISGFGGLSSTQLSLADGALNAARRGRDVWEFWKPTIEEIEAQRGWLSDPRVGAATFWTYLEKARDAAGPSEWSKVVAVWPAEILAAKAAYDKATSDLTVAGGVAAAVSEAGKAVAPLAKPIFDAGKWIVVGLVAVAAITVVSRIPTAPRRSYAGEGYIGPSGQRRRRRRR